MTVYQSESVIQFFKHKYENLKLENPSQSIERVARKSGLGASSLKMLFSANRSMKVSHIIRLGSYFNLAHSEIMYLIFLSFQDSESDVNVKRFFSRALKDTKSNSLSNLRLKNTQWLNSQDHMALAVYYLEYKDKIDFKIIEKYLGFKKNEAEKLLGLLTDEKSQVDTLGNGSFHVTYDRHSSKAFQKNYVYKNMKSTCDKLLVDFENKDSLYRAYTLSLNSDKYKDFLVEMQDIFEKYLSMPTDTSDDSCIVHAGVYSFVTIPLKKENSKV